jgi:hypothetical protein
MKRVFALLNEMVRDGALENYAVAGAIGAMFYVEPFSTQDIDVLVMTPEDGLVIELPGLDYLKARGYTEFSNEGIVIAGWPVQFLRPRRSSSGKLISMRRFHISRRFRLESFCRNIWLPSC